MDQQEIIQLYKEEQKEIIIQQLIENISISYSQLKNIEESNIDIFDRQELSLHKVKQLKLITSIQKKEYKELQTLTKVIEEIPTLKDIIIKEINYLDNIQSLIHNIKNEEQQLWQYIILDQQSFILKLLYINQK